VESAAKILTLGGVLNIAYALITGLLIARIRHRSPVPPKYLMLAHMGPLMQGTMLLALTAALPLSRLAAGTESFAAWLLVGSTVALGAGNTLSYVMGVEDEFTEKPPGYFLGGVTALLSCAGIGILLTGVFRGL
jgi:hypothetical protein